MKRIVGETFRRRYSHFGRHAGCNFTRQQCEIQARVFRRANKQSSETVGERLRGLFFWQRAICNPAAVPGEIVAARAGYRVGSRGEPGVTGSIAAGSARRVARLPTFRHVPGRDEVYDGLPKAVAGED